MLGPRNIPVLTLWAFLGRVLITLLFVLNLIKFLNLKLLFFIFKKCWVSQESFADQMATWWYSYLLNDNKAFEWKYKLDKIRSKLKKRLECCFRADLRVSKQNLTQVISDLESLWNNGISRTMKFLPFLVKE
jgi:hypothetical protein